MQEEKTQRGLRPAERVILVASACLACFFLGWFLRGSVQSRPIDSYVLEQLPARTASPVTALPESGETALVNINTAGLDELMTLPNIGEKRAQDILDYREAHGPFSITEELTDIDGIGEKIYAELEHLVTTGG